MNDDLLALRIKVSQFLVIFLWCQVPLVAGVAFQLGHDVIGPTVLASANAAVATLVWLRASAELGTRLVISVSIVIMVSVILAVCAGAPWQPDVHMYYFATLAITAAYCDLVVILVCASAIAVHHLGLNVLAPALVFPDGAAFSRVILHAVILILETSALGWMAYTIGRLIEARTRLSREMIETERSRAAEADALRVKRTAELARIEGDREKARAEAKMAQDTVVAALADGLRLLARGDLTKRFDRGFPGEYEALRADFNEAAGSLAAAVRQMAEATEAIGEGTGQLATNAADLAHRTEQQAASLEETSAALNGIAEAVRTTAAGASDAAKIVAATRDDAQASGTIVEKAVDAMDRIKDSSTQITNIIGVIDEIAFQTNLLALNAGVEAARAGDAGRGFAVVASEVRGLAQRSAEAAKDIKALISTSTAQVETGVDLVGKAGASLRQIASRVAEIDQLVGGISASSREQATGLAEINTAMRHMDEGVQRNAAMVEESSAVTHALRDETNGLVAMVGKFRVRAA